MLFKNSETSWFFLCSKKASRDTSPKVFHGLLVREPQGVFTEVSGNFQQQKTISEYSYMDYIKFIRNYHPNFQSKSSRIHLRKFSRSSQLMYLLFK